ncbi:uncharacterized protein BP5553_00204 [Venustampulla echinocandica]|uniref:Uncharacterized protein n=1 Tax=Venustampulla echinocandica TaxID=2656787 RepID=A0A370TXG1_9HELO|nr:uncharacterized protein BP5553_00204 [Venustampulla echinocandica]RDL40225.1 hypothetical protein BP5553_00204 [Venustampulla echinocandica]
MSRVLILLILVMSCLTTAQLTTSSSITTPPVPFPSPIQNAEDTNTIEDAQDPYDEQNMTESLQWGLLDLEYEPGIREWRSTNYSSSAQYMVVTTQGVDGKVGKVYDIQSWKGSARDDWFSVAFHLSTEVAVSAAQARNGTLLDLAKIDGDKAYKDMMAQIQQDRKGNRSEYHARPLADEGLIAVSNYLNRLYKYLRRGPPPPQPITDPYPIFTNIISTLHMETEKALGVKLNASSPNSDEPRIVTQLSAPWNFNHTYTLSLKRALDDLGFLAGYRHFHRLDVRPDIEWTDHANDEWYWGGENGTRMAFQYAREGAEMTEYDPEYWYGDFVCGTSFVEEDMRIRMEMEANGTWLEPPPMPTPNILNWEFSMKCIPQMGE